MNFLKNRELLRSLLEHADVMHTVRGGVSQTSLKFSKSGEDTVIIVSNPSVSPEGFNFTIINSQLIINVVSGGAGTSESHEMGYPIFTHVVNIPFYTDISRIEATYDHGEFRVLLPYNQNLPKQPIKLRVKFNGQ